MKILIYICLPLVFVSQSVAQDKLHTPANFALLSLNPGYSGSNGLFRTQHSLEYYPLSGLNDSFYFLNSADVYIKPIKAGIGLTALSESSWNLNDRSAGLSYAQHIRIGEKVKVIPSVFFNVISRKIDYTSLRFDGAYSQYLPSQEPSPTVRRLLFDVSSGLLFRFGKSLYFGAYVFHINQPDQGLLGVSKLHARFDYHITYTFLRTEKRQVQVFSRFAHQYRIATFQMGVSAVFYKHLLLNAFYAGTNDLGLAAGFRSDFCSALVSCNFTGSRLAGQAFQGCTASLSFNLREKEKRRTLTLFEEM